MVDTPRNKTDVMAGLADNTSQAITPQKVRDGFETFFSNRGISVLDYIPTSLHASIKDGTNGTDLGTYIRNAFAAVPISNGTLTFPPGVYYSENSQTEPYSGNVNCAVIVAFGYTNLTIMGWGATLRQTSAVQSNGGAFTFTDCIDCRIVGMRLDGYWNYPNGLSNENSSNLVKITGACVGVQVLDCAVKGGRGLCELETSTGAIGGTSGQNIVIRGTCYRSQRGVTMWGSGPNILVDIVCIGVHRSLLIDGCQGIQGRVSSIDTGANDIIFEGDAAAACQDIDLQVDLRNSVQAISIQNNTTAGTIRRIRISGKIAGTSSGAGILMNAFHATGTIFEDLDFSGLTVYGTTAPAVQIVPDVAATLRRMWMPNCVAGPSVTGWVIQIDNTNNANISDLYFNDRFIEYGGPAWTGEVILINNGTAGKIKRVFFNNCTISKGTTSGVPMTITSAVDTLFMVGSAFNGTPTTTGVTNIISANNRTF